MRYLAVMIALLASLPSAAAQTGGTTALRTVILERSLARPLLPDDPVKIVKVLFNGVEVKTGIHALPEVKPGEPFQAGDDWFNRLTVVLKNISSKKIVESGILVVFPDQIAEGSQVGNRPKHARYSVSRGVWQNDPARPAILIEPGEEFGLPAIEPESFEEIKQAIEARGVLYPASRHSGSTSAGSISRTERGGWGGTLPPGLQRAGKVRHYFTAGIRRLSCGGVRIIIADPTF